MDRWADIKGLCFANKKLCANHFPLGVGVPHLSNDVVMCPPGLPRSPQVELKVGGGFHPYLQASGLTRQVPRA